MNRSCWSFLCLWAAFSRAAAFSTRGNGAVRQLHKLPLGLSSRYNTPPFRTRFRERIRLYASSPTGLGGINSASSILNNNNNNATTISEAVVSQRAPPQVGHNIPNDVRRRQLLMSMLSVASLSPSIKKAFATDETIYGGSTITTSANDPVETVDVIKSPLDDRDYLALTLGNGLRVLLCSDPSTTEAAVAMSVHVGACSDPKEVPGLAHFTEHMLFLGTKQYPQENSFEAFLSNNGGSSNAFTDSEDTVYYFDMEGEAKSKFSEGLKRFGSFFSDPLFTEAATGRELNAIESENKKNLQSDTFRLYQIAKSRANSDHPFSKFFTGNRFTLLDQTVAQGINLREQLIKFYKTYYSANQMTLAIVAPQSIDELKSMATDAFSAIPNNNVDKPELAWAGIAPFGGNSIVPSFGYAAEVVPVQDLRQIILEWPVRYDSEQELQEERLYKTSVYVAHLLGHEGPRSLLSYLKRRGWANSIAAAVQDSLADFQNFEIVVGLTTLGLASVNQVIESIYSYIGMIRDRQVPSYVVNEVLQLEELQWRFLTKGSPRNYVTGLASSMQKYDPALYVAGPRRIALEGTIDASPRVGFTSKDQLDRTIAKIASFTDNLTVDNALLTVLSKNFQDMTDKKERWYGTDYRVREIPSSVIENWKSPPNPKKLQIDFPNPNPFIPSEAGLFVRNPAAKTISAFERTFESRLTPLVPPRVIRDDGPDGRWTVYFKEDDRFGLPKAYLVAHILTRDAFASPKNAALASLYEVCVSDRLGEYAYDAGLAGLMYEVKIMPRGIRLTFGGYNDKLKDFVEYVSRKLSKDIRKLLPRTDQEFDRYKDQVMRGLSAFDVKQPYFHASYYAQLLVQPRKFQYTNRELRDETRAVLLPDLIEYAENIWKKGRGEALIQGNLSEKEAASLVNVLGEALPFRSIADSEVPPHLEALPLPPSESDVVPTRVLVAEPNPSNENSCAYVMLQSLDQSEKSHVLIELLNAVVSEPFYDDLRTKQQLGYIVSSGVRGLAGTRTLAFVVQSSVAASASLSVSIFKFLDSVEDKILKKLSQVDFSIFAKSLIDQKTETDKELATEVTRNWSEISSGRLEFDRVQKEARALLGVSKEDLLEFWRDLYTRNGRRMLISEMIPRQGDAASPLPPSSSGYESGDNFVSGLVLGIDDIEPFRRDTEKLLAARLAREAESK